MANFPKSLIAFSPSKAATTSLLRITTAFAGMSNPAIAGGLLSGGLHAVTGPDHLAAILPSSIGQRWWCGLRIGAIWGLGHGLSATLLGLGAFFLKGRMSSKFKVLQQLSSLSESVVGLSLIAIGLLGVKEATEVEPEEGTSDSEESSGAGGLKKSSTAIFSNGMLHGFSWDGAPSVAPALAMTSWSSALSFLLSYCIGTMLAMSVAAGLVGEGSVRLGKVVNTPDLPKKLSFFSSLAAIAIGVYWVAQAVIF